MSQFPAIRKLLCLLPVTLFLGAPAGAQPLDGIKTRDELNRVMAGLDGQVFDTYNRCDLEKFAGFFDADVEFYHDQAGPTRGIQALKDGLKKNICGKVRRELVAGSLRAYPMKGYGALQMGVHRFLHPGREEIDKTGEASFVHLWQYRDGAWKITRVLSYDHHALE